MTGKQSTGIGRSIVPSMGERLSGGEVERLLRRLTALQKMYPPETNLPYVDRDGSWGAGTVAAEAIAALSAMSRDDAGDEKGVDNIDTPVREDVVKRLVEALDDLQQAEAEYRLMHDRHGDGSQAAGRAWDLMRRAGDKGREALSSVGGEG